MNESMTPKVPVSPVIDRNRCEGKNDCVTVCPEDVFEVRTIDEADFARLSFFGKLKSRAHGRKTAYTPKASACESCGRVSGRRDSTRRADEAAGT